MKTARPGSHHRLQATPEVCPWRSARDIAVVLLAAWLPGATLACSGASSSKGTPDASAFGKDATAGGKDGASIGKDSASTSKDGASSHKDAGADALAGDAADGGFSCNVSNPDYTVGLRLCQPGVEGGYILYPAKHRPDVYLLDRLGRVVHHWSHSQYQPGQMCYLRDNGNLVRAAQDADSNLGGGEGGRLEEYDWDDNLVWAFNYNSSSGATHHDFKILPNGNLLMLAIETEDSAAAAAVGFDPTQLSGGIVEPEMVIEVENTGPTSFNIVWQWHVWDHLIENQDTTLADFGDPASNPGLLAVPQAAPVFWNHANSINYNADLDQIVISARSTSEFWVVDHSTTTAEAATHAGGRYGKGGDFLYRWGNPGTYLGGGSGNQMLFQQHDAQWIDPGLPGAGNFLVLNNGNGRPAGAYSSLDELVSPGLADGGYPALASGRAWGPTSLTWTYVDNPPTDFYTLELGGVQRMPNGNTMACEGVPGRFFEVTPSGERVWEYVNPVDDYGPMEQYEIASLDPMHEPENAVFKTYWYPASFAGFSGKDLTPGDVIESSATSCPVINPSYICKDPSACTGSAGTDVSDHFTCATGSVCCFLLIQDPTPPNP
jgi:hypothetical protein